MRIELLTPEGEKYIPLPAQAAFHSSPSKFRAYIGAFGSGKSLCGAMETVVTMLEYPGCTGLIARYNYKELLLTAWDTLTKIIPSELIQDINKSIPQIKLKNKSSVMGWNLSEHQQQQSLNLDFVWIEEANEKGVDESNLNQLAGRMRGTKGPRRCWLTGNPGGRNWLWKRFFAHTEDPTAKKWRDHAGFRAGTTENIYLPDDYIQALKDTYDDEWLAKYFSGSFDVFIGAILDNFKAEFHVIEPFRIPDEWPRFRGMDHGLTNPTACLWVASDFAGNMFVFREYYKKESVIQENVKAILAMGQGEPEPEWTVIDPATHQREAAGGDRIIDLYRKAGLSCQPGDNDFKSSVARIRSLLAPNPGHKFPDQHQMAGNLDAPKLYVFSSCPWLKWEMENWRWADVKPGQTNREKQWDRDNHAVAALRYLVMRSPRVAVEKPEATQFQRFQQIVAEMEGHQARESDLEDPRNLIGSQDAWRRGF